jgi:hypothetical protein
VHQSQLTGVTRQIRQEPGAGTWQDEISYKLHATVIENLVVPNPASAQPGSYSAEFSLAGTVTETLAPVTPMNGATWVINGTISEEGSISGALNMPSSTAPVFDHLMWTAQINETGRETPLHTPGPSQRPWNFQANIHSSGMLMEHPAVPILPAALAATFMQQDVVTACFMPVLPLEDPRPDPCIPVIATCTTAGSVTDTVRPGVDSGITRYADSVNETIKLPDGGVRDVMENSQNSGTFIIAVLVG